jgi:hypothetical protein
VSYFCPVSSTSASGFVIICLAYYISIQEQIGIAVMSLVVFTGKAPEMLSVYPALYQLFWLLPIYFVSRVYI